jgi:hypothetical protein
MARTQIKTPGIADNSVTTAKIADNSVTTAKIANGNVTTAKLDSTVSGALVPIGGIIMWSGSIVQINNLPGWRLCNGANGTPDLRERFVVGAGGANTTDPVDIVPATGLPQNQNGYSVGENSGSANATLVSHSHTVTTSSASVGGTFKAFFVSIARIAQFNPPSSTNDAMDSMARGGSIGDFADNSSSSVGRGALDTAGSSATNKNLPPYYALAFIMRVS